MDTLNKVSKDLVTAVSSSNSPCKNDSFDRQKALLRYLIALIIFTYCWLGGVPPENNHLFEIPLAAADAPCFIAPAGNDFSGKNLTNCNFNLAPSGTLRGANFSKAILKGAIFAGQDLTNANFDGADLGPSDKGSVDFSRTTLEKTSFVNATMNATDFTYATIKCANFSNTSLIEAEFGPTQKIVAGNGCRTRFDGATLDVQTITTDNWGNVNFSNTHFQNLTPGTFSLKNQNITGAILVNTNFIGIDMTGADLTDVDFSDADLTNVILDNTALNGSKLLRTKLRHASLKCSQFYGSKDDNHNSTKDCPDSPPNSNNPKRAADLTQANLLNADLSNATLNFAKLHGANLSGASLKNASLIGANLEPTESISAASLIGADLTNAVFKDAHINNVQFTNAILTGANFDQTTLAGTSFIGSIMPNASFDQATLEAVAFDNTILQQAKFTNTTMKTIPQAGGSGVSFTCAQLGGSSFKDATITAANFQAAVMPPAKECCQQGKNDPPWCGTINDTQQNYGPVTYPVLSSNITCPNGDVGACNEVQWMIPNWQTNLCNSDRNMETVWRPPDCGTTPGKIVKFKDPNLKQCILASLPGNPSEITVQTAGNMHQVTCPGRGIKDLSGLENFTKLAKLDLTANQLTQFSLPLGNLSTLKIADNQLNVLSVSGLKNLIELDASNNQLQAIPGMAELNYLQILDVSDNQLPTFDLAIQDPLIYVDLSNNKLTDILDQYNLNLNRLKGLSYLNLSNNSLTTIGALDKIANIPNPSNPDPSTGALETLYLECNPTFDCNSLQLKGGFNDQVSPALQTSQCADFNSQSSEWIVLKNPQCSATSARGVR